MLEDDGVNRKSLTFTNMPFKITIKNYKGEDYNAYVDVNIQKTSDSNKVKTAIEKSKQINSELKKMFAGCLNDEDPIINDMNMGNIALENPYPSTCDECKQIILSKIKNKEFTHDIF